MDSETELDSRDAEFYKICLTSNQKKKNLHRAKTQSPFERRICCVCGSPPSLDVHTLPSGIQIDYLCGANLTIMDLVNFSAEPGIADAFPRFSQWAKSRARAHARARKALKTRTRAQRLKRQLEKQLFVQ
jgi:hypothetical protein